MLKKKSKVNDESGVWCHVSRELSSWSKIRKTSGISLSKYLWRQDEKLLTVYTCKPFLCFFLNICSYSLIGATKSICEEEGIKIPTETASTVLTTARGLYKCKNHEGNNAAMDTFFRQLSESLKGCLVQSTAAQKSQIQRMWNKFHTLWISDSFRSSSASLFKSANHEANPVQ